MTTQNATTKRTNCGKTHICMKLKVACTPIQMFWANDRGEQSEWSVCVCVAMAMWPLAEVSSLCRTYPEYKARRTNHDGSWTVAWYGVNVFHFIFLSFSCWGFLFVCLGIGFFSLFFVFLSQNILLLLMYLVNDFMSRQPTLGARNRPEYRSTESVLQTKSIFR